MIRRMAVRTHQRDELQLASPAEVEDADGTLRTRILLGEKYHACELVVVILHITHLQDALPKGCLGSEEDPH